MKKGILEFINNLNFLCKVQNIQLRRKFHKTKFNIFVFLECSPCSKFFSFQNLTSYLYEVEVPYFEVEIFIFFHVNFNWLNNREK